MRWRRVRNPDVIDRRGARSGGAGFPMGRGGAVGGGLGLVGVMLVLALQLLGGNGAAFDVDTGLGDGVSAPGQPAAIPPSEDPERDLKDFSAYVFTDAQKLWEHTFRRAGAALRTRTARPLPQRRAHGLRRGELGGWSFLLSWRPSRVPRSQLLRALQNQL